MAACMCFSVVSDIASRPEWGVRLVAEHAEWEAPGVRGCCDGLSDPRRAAEPHHLRWLHTGWASRLPYLSRGDCGSAVRWLGGGSRPTAVRTVLGFWGWRGRRACQGGRWRRAAASPVAARRAARRWGATRSARRRAPPQRARWRRTAARARSTAAAAPRRGAAARPRACPRGEHGRVRTGEVTCSHAAPGRVRQGRGRITAWHVRPHRLQKRRV